MSTSFEVPASLAGALAEGRVLPFVGAGVSMAVQRENGTRLLPSWRDLLLHAAARLEAEKRKQHTLVRAHLEQDRPDYLMAAKHAKEGLAALWPSFLAENLDFERKSVRDDSLELARRMWSLGSTLVVTTNYDRILQWACPNSDDLRTWTINAPGAQAEELRRPSGRPILWKLHGSIDEPSSVILCPDGYARLYTDESRGGEYLAALETLRVSLITRTLLFVGFSLDDEHVLRQFEWLRETFSGYGGPHYALLPRWELERAQHQVSGLNVQLLAFQDFGGPLIESLDRLCAHAVNASSSREPAVRPNLGDAELEVTETELEQALRRRDRLRELGADTSSVDSEILQLKRTMREGGCLRQGDVLANQYTLLEEVGEGGFGTVWRARDRESSRTVAIKVLHGQFALDRTRRERFFRGARVMRALEDPNIVRVLEVQHEDGGFYFFVMELIEGRDLDKVIRDNQLARDLLIPLILIVAKSLQTAHARGIVHRDVRPANIIVTRDGIPYLTDFDLVWDRDTTGGTRTGALGTFLYAAPEAMMRAQDASPRADVYSLAMTLMFMLRGGELSADILRDTESQIEALACSTHVKLVLRQALELEPTRRYANAGEFREALLSATQAGAPLRVVPDHERELIHWQARGRAVYESVVLRPSASETARRLAFDGMAVATTSSMWLRGEQQRPLRIYPLAIYKEPEEVEIEPATVRDDIFIDFASGRGILVAGSDPPPHGVQELVSLNRNYHYFGSVGPWLFLGIEEDIDGGGAHGEIDWTFKIFDLERARSNTLTEFLSPAELHEICARGIPQARAEFLRRPDDRRPWESSKLELVTIAPRYSFPEGNLRLRCQFAGGVAYAFSDGNWDSYTTSVFVDLDFVPARLEPFAQLPVVLSRYWSTTGVPTGHYGWSVVGDGPFTRKWLDALELDPRARWRSTSNDGMAEQTVGLQQQREGLVRRWLKRRS